MSHSYGSRVVPSKTARARKQRPSRSYSTPSGGRYGAQGYRLGSEESEPPQNESQCGSSSRSEGGRSLESHGAHYMLNPDTSKHSKLKSTARQEEQQYQEHKERQRERTSEMLHQQRPEAVGGPRLSGEDLQELRSRQEKQQQMEAKYAAVRQRQKREEYQREKRQKEEEEYQQKKQIQREKAERLKEKQQAQQELDREEIRRKRLAKFGGGQ